MKPVLAFVDTESLAAFVYAEGFSAVRNADGAWKFPAPDVLIRELESDGYVPVSAEAAETLLNAARMASSVSPDLAK